MYSINVHQPIPTDSSFNLPEAFLQQTKPFFGQTALGTVLLQSLFATQLPCVLLHAMSVSASLNMRGYIMRSVSGMYHYLLDINCE